MKIIQGLKKIKELQKRISDLQKRIRENCADMETDEPVYADQRSQIDGWIQAIHDSVKEIMRLRCAIQLTNLKTIVTININDLEVGHTISEWIHRRRDLAGIEEDTWSCLSDKGLTPKAMNDTADPNNVKVIKVRRYYSPEVRDKNIDMFKSEPQLIDATLEVVNAETDLIE